MAVATGEMQETIEGRLTEALSPVHLEVINESHMHAGPAKESHFKVGTSSVVVDKAVRACFTRRPAVCSACSVPAYTIRLEGCCCI